MKLFPIDGARRTLDAFHWFDSHAQYLWGKKLTNCSFLTWSVLILLRVRCIILSQLRKVVSYSTRSCKIKITAHSCWAKAEVYCNTYDLDNISIQFAYMCTVYLRYMYELCRATHQTCDIAHSKPVLCRLHRSARVLVNFIFINWCHK